MNQAARENNPAVRQAPRAAGLGVSEDAARQARLYGALKRGATGDSLNYVWVLFCLLVGNGLGLTHIQPVASAGLFLGAGLWTASYFFFCRRLILSGAHYRPRASIRVVTFVASMLLLALVIVDGFSLVSAALMITSLVLSLIFYAEAHGALSTLARALVVALVYSVAYRLTPKTALSLSVEQFVLVLLVVVVLGLMMGVVAYSNQAKTRQIVDLLKGQREHAAELAQSNVQLEEDSLLDALTGVANRRFFDRALDRELGRSARHQRAFLSATAARPQVGRLALILLDIDHFKAYNDHLGHVAGDDCLRRVAQAMAGALKRPGDQLSRYGGEEFAVVLAETDLAGGGVVAQRILDAVAGLEIPHPASSVGPFVTVSAGVADGPRDQSNEAQRLVVRADEALYEAKECGRGRVASAQSNESAQDAPVEVAQV